MTTHPAPMCVTCRHLSDDGDATFLGCAAFPRGIPQAILESRRDHRRPYPGDHGIQYEPIEREG